MNNSILDTETIGRQITYIRKRKGIGRLKLAESVNISPFLLKEYESGTIAPSLPHIVDIANSLEVPVDYIINPTQIQEVKSITKSRLAPVEKLDKLTGEINEVLSLCTIELMKLILDSKLDRKIQLDLISKINNDKMLDVRLALADALSIVHSSLIPNPKI